MAIIKTGNTELLAHQVAISVRDAVNSTWSIAKDVQLLKHKMDAVAPGTDGAGESADGTSTWNTHIGATTAAHVEEYIDAPWDNSSYYNWLENGVKRFGMSGSNLDGAVQGDAIATRYSYNYDYVSKLNVGGATGSDVWHAQVSAKINYDLSSNVLQVSQFTATTNNKVGYSGYASGSGADGKTYSEVYKEAVAFVGDAQYDISSLPALVKSTIYSFAKAWTEVEVSDGSAWEDSYAYSRAYTFKLGSSGGLNYSAQTSLYSGAIDSILYSSAGSIRTGYDDPEKYDEYFKWIDTTASSDDINLNPLSNLLMSNNLANREAWRAELLKGDDTIVVTDREGGAIKAGAGNDKVTGGVGADVISGESGNDQLSGGDGADRLNGGLGNDILKGGAHDDELEGEDGDDFIDGGSGNDYLGGGAGNDTLKGGAHDDYIEGGDGDDLLDGGSGNDELFGDVGNDRLLGGLGNDVLYGGAGDDVLDGGAGNDDVEGGQGNDTISGGAGNDLIYGNTGNDTIDGGAGNDLIIGGVGVDVMTGGSGIDGFYFKAGDSGLALGALDQIKGFNVAQDQILFNFNLSESDVFVLDASASYDSLLVSAEAANKRIAVGYDAGNTYVFADMDNNGSVDLAVQLVGIKGATVAHALNFEFAVI